MSRFGTRAVLFIAFLPVYLSIELNDPCFAKSQSVYGVCKLITQCLPAIENMRKDIIPDVCGFQGLEPIVCCVSNATARANITISKSKSECNRFRKLLPEREYHDFFNGGFLISPQYNYPYVLGGTQSVPAEFKHMAALGYGQYSSQKLWLCGGSLISERFVLTAAHCLYSKNYGLVQWVRLGSIDLYTDYLFGGSQDFEVSERFRHPNYTSLQTYNDIGLVKLNRNAYFTLYVFPACLNTIPNLNGMDMIATGWGETENGTQSDILMKVDLSVYPDRSCTELFPPGNRLKNGIRTDLQFCAGNLGETKDTCQGDSGGPLKYQKDKLFYIAGITSFGKSCGILHLPAVYTRVSNFVPWIESIVWS